MEFNRIIPLCFFAISSSIHSTKWMFSLFLHFEFFSTFSSTDSVGYVYMVFVNVCSGFLPVLEFSFLLFLTNVQCAMERLNSLCIVHEIISNARNKIAFCAVMFTCKLYTRHKTHKHTLWLAVRWKKCNCEPQ